MNTGKVIVNKVFCSRCRLLGLAYILSPVPGSLDKKGERGFHLSSVFCLIKDGTLFPPHAMINEPVPVQSEVEELSQYYEEGEQQAHKMTHLVPGGSWT
jgi:hypothetical protein